MRALRSKSLRGLSALLLVAGLSQASCGGEVTLEGTPRDPRTAQTLSAATVTATGQSIWSPAVRRVVIEVDYGPNAAPYTGTVPGVGDAWGILRANAERLFRGSGKTIVLPTTLGQMQRIEVASREFTTDDLVALSRRWRNQRPTADTATLHVMVLDGWYRDPTLGRRTDLLGGSLGNTGIIVLFKPVVASTALAAQPYVSTVVEQTTLVHEFGHAVGLVDNGAAPGSSHHDAAHVHHCTSASCVMNAWNEGASAARAFVMRYAMTRDPVIFDGACLADAAAAIAAARR